MNAALEAALRRDRVIVLAALAIITATAWADLAWLADDMAMGGMDMTGFRMIPAGRSLMMPASEPWQPMNRPASRRGLCASTSTESVTGKSSFGRWSILSCGKGN